MSIASLSVKFKSRSLIQEFMLYDFEVGHNIAEATKNTSAITAGAVE